jgi:hypothetical protein
MAITFQYKVTYKFYTIVEWPLTPVPTLTPANSTTQTTASNAVAANIQTPAPAPIQQQQKQPQTPPPPQQQQQQQAKLAEAASTSIIQTESESLTNKQEATVPTEPVIPAPAPTLISNQIRQSKLNQSNSASPTSAANPSTPQNINTTSVNTILKKLGVNVQANQSPLSSLISNMAAAASAGQNANSVNSVSALNSKNSVVNVNLNVLKDVNIDEMIDDDDDEERKFLIKELEKKAINK